MQLNTVVLPAPFGPISAVMAPRAAEKERSSTATSPPKRMDRCSTRSTGAALGALINSLPYLPLKGGGAGGPWPPSFAIRTPMRSIGYARSGRVGVCPMTPPRIAFGNPTLPFQGRDKERDSARSSVAFLDERTEDGAALLVEGRGLTRADKAARL